MKLSPHFPAKATPPQELSRSKRKSYRRLVLYRASKATPNLPPSFPVTLRWKCTKLLKQAVSAVTKPSPPLPQHPQAAPTFPSLQEAQSTRKNLRSPSPVTLSRQLREDFNLESEEEIASPSPKPPQLLSPPFTPVPGHSSGRSALPALQSSPSLYLNISPLDRRDALNLY